MPDSPQTRCALRAFPLMFALALVAALLTAALAARPAFAEPTAPSCSNTITVQNGNDSGGGSLRQAIADVCAGGTIYFANYMTVTLASQLIIDKSLTIEGQERRVTISGNNVTRVFSIAHVTPVKLNRITIANGRGVGTDATGGAISSNSNGLTIESCVLTGNATDGNGGAIYNDGIMTVQNSTLTNNKAGSSGGAIYDVLDRLTLLNVTIMGNQATTAGGLFFERQPVESTATNTIVAGQLSGGNCNKILQVGNNNLSDTTSCGSTFTTVGLLLLGSLGDYGGDTNTVPLLPGSPAIDAGNTAKCPGSDQRGFPRVGTCDIGAFESQGFTLTPTGGNNQSAFITENFATPLTVSVAPKQPGEPVEGGRITFTPPASGASAVITGSPATISSGSAGVTAAANATAGTYNVTASPKGASSATFSLTNTCNTSTVVTSNADSGAGSLRAAITHACAGGTITFDADRTVSVASQLAVNKSLTIDGTGHKVTLDGGAAAPLLTSSGSSVALTHLTFASGASGATGQPAGVRVTAGTVTVTASTFKNNVSASGVTGGALTLDAGATATVTNSSFTGNKGAKGGAVYNAGTLTLTNASFWGNSATDSGGALGGTGGATVNNVLVGNSGSSANCVSFTVASGSGNNFASDTTCSSSFTQSGSLLVGAAAYYGGDTPVLPLLPGRAAIDAGNDTKCPTYDQRSYPRVRSCDVGAFEASFLLNKTGGDNQGALVNTAFANPLVVTVQPAYPGDPVDGGVVTFSAPASGASATLSGSNITVSGGKASVTATANGTTGSYQVHAAAKGAPAVDFTLTNQACSQVVTNNGNSGAGSLRQAINDVCSGGSITFNGDYAITLTSPLSFAKSLTIDATGHKVSVSGNNAVQVFNITGGGNTVTLRSLTIANARNYDFGGGIYSTAKTTVDRCTFTGNRSSGGGAIYAGGGTLTVTNSTFSGNISDGAGGALYNQGATVTLTNATLSGGSAATIGGGIYTDPDVGAATTKLISSIVGGSTAGGNCAGKDPASSSKNNVSDDNTCFGFTQGSLSLDPLANYGGDTQTFRLKSDSPAIDAGASCQAYDQRGQARSDWTCDAGAFELKLTDSGGSTVTKAAIQGSTVTFGPTLVKVKVNYDAGCLTSITVTRYDQNNPNAPLALQTGHWWAITSSPAGCQDFSVDLTLPVDWTPDTTGLDTVCAYTGSGVAWDCAWTSSATSSVSNTLTRAGLTHFSQWAAGHNTGPCSAPAPPVVSISTPYQNGVSLTWPAAAGANWYEVWTAQNAPYFNIGGKLCGSASPYTCLTTTGTTYASSDLGNPASNPSYQVRAANNCGQLSGASKRVGGFTFSLIKGN